MSSRVFKGAGVVAAVLGVVLIIGIFALLGTVDIIYMNDGREVYRQENVNALSKIDDPNANMAEEFRTEGGLEFTYGEKEFNPEEAGSFKVEIVKKLVINLFTFKWGELDNDIVMQAK